MPSTGPMNGTAIILKVGATAVALLESNDIAFNRAVIEVTNKDSLGWKDSIYGLGSASINCSGVFAEDSTWGFDEAYAAILNKTELSLVYGSAVTGDKIYTCTALITSLSQSAPMEDKVTFSATFEVIGAPVQSTL